MERLEIVRTLGNTARRVNGAVVEYSPRILRPGGVGIGLAATIDKNYLVAGLSFGVAGGSALVLELRRRARNRNNTQR